MYLQMCPQALVEVWGWNPLPSVPHAAQRCEPLGHSGSDDNRFLASISRVDQRRRPWKYVSQKSFGCSTGQKRGQQVLHQRKNLLHTGDKTLEQGIDFGFEIQGSYHQMSKKGVSVVAQNFHVHVHIMLLGSVHTELLE